MSSEMPRSEKTRICPSCRMQISVLATKCRFCGEEVGKPKEEQRTLSIHDLGGEQVFHNAPSGSVIEAMQSFRAEESLAQKAESDEFSLPDLGLPGSDSDGSGDASPDFFADADSSDSAYARRYEKSQVGSNRVMIVLGGIGALALIAVSALVVPGMLAGMSENEADAGTPEYVNAAPRILDRGGDPLEALEAAVEAIGHEDSARNRRIAEDVVAVIATEVNERLDATPFDRENLREASRIASKASSLYASEMTQELAEAVRLDSRAYSMTLLSIDRETKTARFQLPDSGASGVEVQVGDTLADRFQVRSVVGGLSGSVILMDTKRNNRPVKFTPGGLAEAP